MAPQISGRGRRGRKALDKKAALRVRRRLSDFIHDRHGSLAAFGRRGWSLSTVKKWLAGEPSTPDVAALVRLAKEENLSIDWLLTGRGPMLWEDSASPEDLPGQYRARVVAELKPNAGVGGEVVDLAIPAHQFHDRTLDHWRRQVETWRAFLSFLQNQRG